MLTLRAEKLEEQRYLFKISCLPFEFFLPVDDVDEATNDSMNAVCYSAYNAAFVGLLWVVKEPTSLGLINIGHIFVLRDELA